MLYPDIEVVGIHEAIVKLQSIANKAKNLTPIHRHIGNIILNSIEESFDNEASPFGAKWTPSKKTSGKTLTDSGTLSRSFTVNASKSNVTVGTNLVYAAVHNFGGDAGRKKSVKLVARPFIPVQGGELEKGVKGEIMEYLVKKLV